MKITQLSQVDGVQELQELQEFSASRANKFERRQYFHPCKLTQREPSALSSATPVTPELLNSKKLSECET